jgi:hypothetical protein
MLRGLQGDIVETRIIRAAYGVAVFATWNPIVHESEKHRRAAEKLKYHLPHPLCSNNMWLTRIDSSMTWSRSGAVME